MGEFEEKLQSILGDPNAMSQIMSIAQSITAGSRDGDGPSAPKEEDPAPPAAAAQAAADPFSMLGSLDPRLLQVGMRLLAEYNGEDDKKTALLAALRPFVKRERYAKVDQAIQIAKLSRVIRVALDAFRKGDGNNV